MVTSNKIKKMYGLDNTEDNKTQQKANKLLGIEGESENRASSKTFNPFLKRDGSLVNPYYDYQKALDSDRTASITKKYIQEATGLTPSNSGNTELSSMSISGTTGKGQQLVDTAKKYLGTKYVWGGTSPDGFDCSGLLQYAAKENGIDVPRTTYEQIKSGSSVSRENLMPGDFIFFGTESDPHHVGMYVGNGQYIHAPKTGDVVKISDLSGRNDYLTARRYT